MSYFILIVVAVVIWVYLLQVCVATARLVAEQLESKKDYLSMLKPWFIFILLYSKYKAPKDE